MIKKGEVIIPSQRGDSPNRSNNNVIDDINQKSEDAESANYIIAEEINKLNNEQSRIT